ncbi:MAG: murein biosynthesis integral membrane protein MurJ [Anaerolineales bacterium]|nr:murein biosynthesis integral membrane protein MurJ [Anaerolineales bacterium]
MNKLSHLTRISLLLAFFFAADKILAFGKSMLFNKIVGLEGMGIFGAANNIPDYLSALLSGGALGMAFIPVLTEYLDRQGHREAWDLFSRIINLAFVITGAFSVIIILLADPLTRYVIAPGFTPDNQAITTSLMRLDLAAIVIFSISGLVMASLQANQHFLLPALAPVLYNIGQIFGVTILSPSVGLHIGSIQLPAFGLGLHGMVYGVIIGAALHLLIQVPGLIRFQFHWTPILELKSAGVQRVLILLGPRVLTMACIQVYFVARDNLASRFDTVGVGALNLAWTIEQVPETIIGTAIAVALLPSLAEFINRGQVKEFTQTVNRALRVMLALCLPAAVLLALTVRPLAQSFFGYDAARLNLLTACTWAFLIGLVGDTWLEVAVRSFYANQNTRIPLVAAFAQAIAFVVLSLTLLPIIGLAGIPLSAALTFTTQAIVLLVILNRRFPGLLQMGDTAMRALLAAATAGLVSWTVLTFLPFSAILRPFASLLAGGLICLPFIWREIRLLFNL